jgi:acyl dehydratase
MTIDYDTLLNWPFPEIEQTYTEKDSILYALGVGLGNDPLDERQLRYVFEEPELIALPTMAAVLGTPGFWLREASTGVTWETLLHGEQGIELHRPLPSAATVVAQTRVTDILDKGEGRGALIYTERHIQNRNTGESLATLTSTTVARSDGGFGGPSVTQPRPHPLPDRPADRVCDLTSVPQAALIYRLSGDPNPLHASPEVARSAGFDAPILHGLCTLGIAGHAVLKSCLDYEAQRFHSMQLRFSAPVYPGETIRTEMWFEGNNISFRAIATERNIVVLNNGCIGIRG